MVGMGEVLVCGFQDRESVGPFEVRDEHDGSWPRRFAFS